MRKSSRATPWLSAQPHQAALVADQALVDVVELLDQRVDARLVEAQRLHLGDDLVLELLVLRSWAARASRLELVVDVLVLQAAQPLVGIGDGVEGLQHLGLELGFDRGERVAILHIVVVVGSRSGQCPVGVGSSLIGAPGAALNGVAPRARSRRRAAGVWAGRQLRPEFGDAGTSTMGWPPGLPPGAGDRLGVGPAHRSLRGR